MFHPLFPALKAAYCGSGGFRLSPYGEHLLRHSAHPSLQSSRKAQWSCEHGPFMMAFKAPTLGVLGWPKRALGCHPFIEAPVTQFSGILPTTVRPGQAAVLRQEIVSLLEKEAIEELPPTQMESGFYSWYFAVPKKVGVLRPILDLRLLNLALRVSKFKMLTVKSILSQIQPRDWFVTTDLKDAYFHIQIVKRHRKFLRFAFEGKAYQYFVLPFGLALAPRTFTKCMDAALAQLWLQGVRILNYLDD